MSLIERVSRDAAPHGLAVRAAFAPGVDDGFAALPGGAQPRALLLLGNVGSSLWNAFAATPERTDGRADPLNRWSLRIGEDLAQRHGGRALYPFGGPPHHPFQRWALRAGSLFASPVGMLIDPEYGLWHAFRFALALPDALDDAPAASATASPCIDCADQPCLHACPADAFVAGEYRVRGCVASLLADSDARCWRVGCLVRHACPIGQSHRYLPEQANFHMRAFVAALREVN